MARPRRWAALGVLLLGLGACAAHRETQSREQVEAAFRHFCALTIALDHAGLAAMFDQDGQIINAGQEPIQGPAAINRFYAGYAGYQVLAYTTGALQTRTHGNAADLSTTYRQRVRLPDGKIVEVSGRLDSNWRRTRDGHWLLLQVATGSV